MGPPHPAAIYAMVIYALEMVQSLQLPSDMSQELYCAGCEAVVSEVHKLMKKKSHLSLQVRIVDILDDICDPKYFRTYDYIPPKMARACRVLLEHNDEDVEQALIVHFKNRTDPQDALEKYICHKMTKACEGVKKTPKKPSDSKPKIMVNDKEVDNLDLSSFGANAKVAGPPKKPANEEL